MSFDVVQPRYGPNALLEGRDLPEALDGAVRSVMAGASVALEFTVHGDRRPLQPVVETTALRIGREAVVNALKHAGAQKIEVRLEYAPQLLVLQVADDGRGIPMGRRRPRRVPATSGSRGCVPARVAPEAR